ncbi:peptidase family M28 [Diaporthe helianthi]|uniref:Peptide hydrolase n=1 Tax=Diaporthe helianthi TaxID=158607 RepID=A0A2P5HKP5_DIAHE|nr:peptidase family M28 [Diaporthe helianthi]
MNFLPHLCGLLLALARVATASPFSNAVASINADASMRLVKVSESDPGNWVREDEKIEKYVAKGVNFVDITDMSVGGSSSIPSFYNRYYRSTYGTEASNWLYNQVVSAATPNPAISVTRFSHSFNQPSVIAKIPGSSSDALVIVGAHLDSTGGSSSARGPGADDNGSGVVVIFEALRILAGAGFKPRNTLEFHFYAGEEGGLLGSQDVFKSYKSANKQVLAMVNQDMAGYSPSGVISIYTDYVDSSLTAYVRRVAEEYTGLNTSTDTCGYGCSDHHSAYSNGFPAAYVCDEVISTSSPYIHSPSDSYNTIMWDAIERHTKFTVGFLVEASYL